MTSSITKKDSGKIFYFDINAEVQGKNQWLFDDEFLIYTIYNPLLDWSNKLILKGNFTYKGDVLESALINEIAFFYIQKLQDGIIQEHGYGYKLGEGIAGDINNPFSITDKDATGVSFHYSNHEYQQDWTSGMILGGYPPSNDRSVIEESIFGNYVQEGWIDNPFSISLSSSSSLTDLQAYNYIASNNDLISAFEIDIEAAKSHYTNYGISEGRSLDSFDEWQYLASNGDLINPFGSNTTAAIKHYVSNGYKEGRSKDSFDEWQYLASHGDLINAFSSDTTAAIQHYVLAGFAEGRSQDSFDEWSYLASNTDLITAFGGNTTTGVQHYVLSGFSESRNTNSFNATNYLNKYTDLQSAFGTDTDLATKHYVEIGFSEGRVF